MSKEAWTKAWDDFRGKHILDEVGTATTADEQWYNERQREAAKIFNAAFECDVEDLPAGPEETLRWPPIARQLADNYIATHGRDAFGFYLPEKCTCTCPCPRCAKLT